eukprot:5813717-Pleurochrysis_carterae.AAC.4
MGVVILAMCLTCATRSASSDQTVLIRGMEDDVKATALASPANSRSTSRPRNSITEEDDQTGQKRMVGCGR